MSYKVNATFIAYALSLLPEKTISLYNCHVHLPKGPRLVHTLSMHLTSNTPTFSAYTDSGCLRIAARHGNLQFSVPMESPLFDNVPFAWTDTHLLIPHFYLLHETHQILQQHLPSFPL